MSPSVAQFRSPIPVSAYLLTASALTPLYGKLSDLIGRKPVLYSAIFIFLVSYIPYLSLLPLTLSYQLGSALCGAAKNLTWLIICRGIQGIGGGGITQLVLITISDIVSLQEYVYIPTPMYHRIYWRAHFQQPRKICQHNWRNVVPFKVSISTSSYFPVP